MSPLAEVVTELPRRLPPAEAQLFAEGVRDLLEKGAPVAADTRSYVDRAQARSRQRTLLRGLRAIDARGISTHLRQGPDGRWRVYATDNTSGEGTAR